MQKCFGEDDFKTADKFYKSASVFAIVTFLLTVADIVAGALNGSTINSSNSLSMWKVLGPDLWIAVCSLIDIIVTLKAVQNHPAAEIKCKCNNVLTVTLFTLFSIAGLGVRLTIQTDLGSTAPIAAIVSAVANGVLSGFGVSVDAPQAALAVPSGIPFTYPDTQV